MESLIKRQDVPPEHRWDVEAIFASDQQWTEALATLKASIPDIKAFQGTLATSPQRLADWLAFDTELGIKMQHLSAYAFMNISVDSGSQTANAHLAQFRSLAGDVMAAKAFAEPEMIAIGMDQLKAWANSEDCLKLYQHYFDKLEQSAAHILSNEIEAVLGQMSDFASTATATHGIMTNTDLSFKDALDQHGQAHSLAQSTLGALLNSPDRSLRASAWTQYADAHYDFKNTMANCLIAGVKLDATQAKLRGYASSLHASLASYHVPVEVFHNTIDTFKANVSTWHRYWEVRRQALGLERLHEWDIKAPLSKSNPKVSYQQAVDWICEGMAPLGEDYVSTMRRGCFEDRWVDIYPNQGKRQGAYSNGVPGVKPFIFMSYSDDLFGMSTLAHELGHSMHSYISQQQQPDIYRRYSLFEAEVASNFNQALTRAYLLEHSDDVEFRIAVIEEAMSNFHRYFFVMPTLARFELEVHEGIEQGRSYSADDLISLMADLYAEGYGDALEIDRDRTGMTWAMFSTHLYNNFYTYQYTTGISAAHALAKNILEGKQNAVANYLQFLASGGSRYPLEALELAGVDMLSPEPVEQTFEVLATTVSTLETLLEARSS